MYLGLETLHFSLEAEAEAEQLHGAAAADLDLEQVVHLRHLQLALAELAKVAAVAEAVLLQVVRLLVLYYKPNQEPPVVADLSGFGGLKVLT